MKFIDKIIGIFKKAKIKKSLRKSLKEVYLIREGKIKPKTWEELKKELD